MPSTDDRSRYVHTHIVGPCLNSQPDTSGSSWTSWAQHDKPINVGCNPLVDSPLTKRTNDWLLISSSWFRHRHSGLMCLLFWVCFLTSTTTESSMSYGWSRKFAHKKFIQRRKYSLEHYPTSNQIELETILTVAHLYIPSITRYKSKILTPGPEKPPLR